MTGRKTCWGVQQRDIAVVTNINRWVWMDRKCRFIYAYYYHRGGEEGEGCEGKTEKNLLRVIPGDIQFIKLASMY